MNKVMKYKGYIGSYSISLEDGVLHGKLECIDDLITYESDSVLGLRDAFHEAVDDYLDTCRSLNKQPNKVLSGSFNVRVGTNLHRELTIMAYEQGVSLNELVKVLLTKGVSKKNSTVFQRKSARYTSEFSISGPRSNEVCFERRAH